MFCVRDAPRAISMEISAALSAELKCLTDALDQPGIDLQQLLTGLADETRRAVDSFRGLTVIQVIDGYPATFTIFSKNDGGSGPMATSASSVRLPLDGVGAAEPGSAIIFYAANPGAFTDFGADLAFSLGLPLTVLVLDGHLAPADPGPSLRDLSHVNQALGILLDGGYLLPEARIELRRLADAGGDGVAAAAARLIAGTGRGPDGRGPPSSGDRSPGP
jgi:hypothetical protein